MVFIKVFVLDERGVFMNNKKIISFILTLAIIFTSIPAVSYSLQAKTKAPVLNNKKVVVKKGKTKTVKLKNATKKVQWKVVSGRKNVKIIKMSGKYQNKIKLKAVKKGNAVLVAVHGKKIYTVKVTVQGKSAVIPQPTVKPKEEPSTKEEVTTEGEKAEYATVTFLDFDGNIAFTIQYVKGKPYGVLPIVRKEGFVMIGWDEADRENVWWTDICEGDITLRPHFVRVLPTVEETYEIVEE